VCECGGFLKPATISFGQNLRNEDLERAEAAAKGADLVVALGSTLSVYPAANIPLLAANRGVPYVIINRGPTEHDDLPEVTLRLEGDVGEIFPPAVEAALARDLEGREPLDLVAKQVDADRKVRRRSEDVDDPAPDRELSAGLDLVLAPVTSVDKASHQVLGIEVRTLVDHDRLCVFDSRAEPLQERAHRSNDYTRRVLRDRARQGHRVARRAVAETPHRAKPPAHGLDRG